MNIVVSDDEKYVGFTFDSLTATEGIALKTKAGVRNRQALRDGIQEDDPAVWQALVWLLRARKAIEAGEATPRFSETDFTWGTCQVEFEEHEMARIREAIREAEEAKREGTDPPTPKPLEEDPPTVASPST